MININMTRTSYGNAPAAAASAATNISSEEERFYKKQEAFDIKYIFSIPEGS
jgi:hypothetical protein